uniref:Spectrin repeat containing, nuclear envelope 1b n=1 Tax=Pygocentrus nattereri TaxID=42514 RepID=A0AAR2ILP8_PYGNA
MSFIFWFGLDEQEAVQKRTFTKWINSHLAKRDPPLVVKDLFEDIKDGVMLLALLEVLSGHKLPCEQGRKLRRIHWLANVGTALRFLEGRRIKLVNINTTDVVDGRPSIVLGLIWTIILYFQIEELTSSLPPQKGQTSSTSSVDSSNSTETASPPVKRKPRLSFQGGAKRALLKWVQRTATKRLGLDVKDFGPSWRSGVAFHAVIFALRPQLVNMERVWNRPNRANLEEAFSLAERELGIPRLLDPEDVDVDKPDEKSIMTYVAQFLKHHPDTQEAESVGQQEEVLSLSQELAHQSFCHREQRKILQELKAWADQLERDCAQAQIETGDCGQQYQSFKQCRVQYELKRRQVLSSLHSTQKDGFLTSDQALLKQAWERLSTRLLDWHKQLDAALPDPLGAVGIWLHQAEKILQEEPLPQQSHEQTANAIHQTLQQHQPVKCPQAFHESKLKSWIVKYGRLESAQLLLQSYMSFVEDQQFFQKYESLSEALKQTAVLYTNADSSGETAEEAVRRFLRDVADQWRSLAVEVRSVRSMLEEVQGNWEKYSSAVSSLQVWLEDAQDALNQPENNKREFFRNLPHWMDQHAAMNDAGNFLIETCDETVSRDLKHQLLLLNGRWRDMFNKAKQVYSLNPETMMLNLSFFVPKAIIHRLPWMEAQYKTAARSVQLRARDTGNGDGRQALTTMASIKGQLYKVKDKLWSQCQVAEANGNLTRRFEESRAELEKTLRVGQACLKERGDPAELFSKHNDFFGRLDQRVLNAYLKACDDLTDILPEEEQQGLQESVRRLHKQWKDIQAEAPVHLLRLRVEAERRMVMTSLQECRLELQKEEKALSTAGSEKVIKEHRAYFRQKDPLSIYEGRLKTMEQLCQRLPENDLMQKALLETKDYLSEVKAEVEYTYMRLLQHPDKWREWHTRIAYCDIIFHERNKYCLITLICIVFFCLCVGICNSLCVHFVNMVHAYFMFVQELHTQTGVLTDQAQSLVKKATEIQLGAQNHSLLHDQAQAAQEKVQEIQISLEKITSLLLTIFRMRGKFKLLPTIPLIMDIFVFFFSQAIEAGLEERMDVLNQLEMECHALTRFITPGEAERIKARLIQISRYWEELKNNVKQRGVELQVKNLLKELAEKLNKPVTSCSSSSETYQALHDHVVRSYVPEKFCRNAGRKKNLESITIAFIYLFPQYGFSFARYERDFSVLHGWLDRCEYLCNSDTPYLTMDKAKLHSQLQMLQVIYHVRTWKLILRVEELGYFCMFSFDAEILRGNMFIKAELCTETSLYVPFPFIQDDESLLQTQREAVDGLQQHINAFGPSLTPEDLQRLQVRKEDCLQPFVEAHSLLQRRSETLVKLETFLVTYRSTTSSLQTLQGAVEGRDSWDQAKAGQLNQELGRLAQELASLEMQAISLDSSLSKSYLHLHGTGGERTSCRRLVDELGSGLQGLQRILGTRQSEADALKAMWNSFRGRKELLLKSLKELEERTRRKWLTEPSIQSFQHRLWILDQLEEELQALQHSQLWLRERGEQLSQRDHELAKEAQQDVTLVQSNWEKTEKLISEEQEQCTLLLETCRDYFNLKSKITSAVERACAVTTAQFGQSNPEDIQRALSRLEAVRPELAGTQEELNLFISKGKRLISELRKLSEDTGESVRAEMDSIVDQWLHVRSVRLNIFMDADIGRLTVSLVLWNEINSIANDIECWSITSVSELSEGIYLFSVFEQLELYSKEEVLEVLQGKVTELQDVTKTQRTPTELQAMEADLRKKILHAEEIYEQTKSILRDFSSKRQQLQDIVSHIAEQLETTEDALSELSQSSDPENVAKIKVSLLHSFPINSLRALCRAYPSQQLTQLGEGITVLVKQSEATALRATWVIGALQETLLQRFNGEREREQRIQANRVQFEDKARKTVIYPLFCPRPSLERLCQASLTMSDSRAAGTEASLSMELLSSHQALVQETWARLRGLQEYQAFMEAHKAIGDWLEEVEERLEKLESTEGNKRDVQERLEQVQDILLMKGEGEVKLNMAAGKGELVIKNNGENGQEVIHSKLQEAEDAWAALLLRAMSCHSRLEWTVSQWDLFVESRAQLQGWLEQVEAEVKGPLEPQLGLREKRQQLERLCLLLTDVEDHQGALCYLEESAAELYKRTGDPTFREDETALLRAQFDDVRAERVRLSEGVVFEHEKYVETVRELTDWLLSKGEELQRCSDPSGDSASIQQKLTDVRGRERLRRVRLSCDRAGRLTAAAGCELMDAEVQALSRALQQWEGRALSTRDALETAVAAATGAERERSRLNEQLEGEMERLEERLKEWSEGLSRSERRNSGTAAVEGWTLAKVTNRDCLHAAEVMEEKLKAQLNELYGFSSDLGPQSERVSALIKLHNSLGLRASRECQNKEKLLEQRFRSSLRDFRQWLVNAKISTAKCFDSPHSIQEASGALQKIQEFMSDREQGQARLDAVLAHGEQLSTVVPADRVEAVRAKVSAASDDWGNLMDNLQQKETLLQGLQSRMQEFEESVQPLQDWLNRTEVTVQESSARLHDLPAKRLELCKLQSVLEEMCSKEPDLGGLRERAHSLWEGQAAGKGFVHRVCQLAARYLALSNRTKEKVSRIERVVGEHQLFSQGLQELQSWVLEAQEILETCQSATANKSVLITRMGQLEALLTARQEREIQLKMLITRGEAVQRNTSAEGVPVVRKQIQDLKDSWDLLLSASIQCKSQLESALSHWTSYQEDVSQFEGWLERVEDSLGSTDKRYTEMRDKTANLRRAKLLYEEVLSRSSPLDTIATKGSNMAENSAAVNKAEELVLVHQEYQRGLHMFEDWLEQEQSNLALLSPLDGDLDTLGKTLKELQMLQSRFSEGHTLLRSALTSREQVIPWGIPQIEERALETAQREWQGYQDRMGDTKAQVEQTLVRLQKLEDCFQNLDQWLVDIELKVRLRSHRRSDSTTKDIQLQQLLVRGFSAVTVILDTHVSARVSARVTQLTARYHALLIRMQETIKQLQEEITSIAEAQSTLRTFSDWLSVATADFRTVSENKEALDRTTMEKKMKKLESLQGNMDHGHSLLKTLRERVEQAVSFLDDSGASKLEKDVQAGRSQLEELILGLRTEHGTTERSILFYKEFQERYKAQLQWLSETRALFNSSVEPKAELYQRRAQLAKYKAVEQALLSRNSAVSSVLEKGENLLYLLQMFLQAQVQRLEGHVKKQEVYHSELQEVERWLLQMSSRMVTPDPAPGSGLEAATQQLARHKAIMEEIAGFEERLAGLKERGEELVSGCSERIQARLRQQTQSHLQGARDSYSAICSTAQRVYQSLDRELQRHVSLRDALQQCQTWLSNMHEELQPPVHTPRCLEEALIQVKQERTLQEQASTYLQLVCSTCDLSDEKVQETAADIQQVKIQRMLESQELAESWRAIKGLRSDLEFRLREAEQLLQNMLRRSAELEPKVAQNQLDQIKTGDFIQEVQARQADLTHLRESVGKLMTGQESPELVEVGRLRRAWLELGKQAAKLLEQREQDLQRSGDYHECLSMAEELFDQLSKEWEYLTRHASIVMYLDALKKLSVDLQDQRCVLDALRDNRNTILPRLGLEDKDLVKEQVGYLEQRWTQLEMQVHQKIQDIVQTLEDLNHLEDQLRETQEWAEVQRPSISKVLKTSPPPDLAQSFLFDHLSFCAELEAKQQLLTQVVSEADSLSSHLGLDDRKTLQALVQEVQVLLESLGSKAAQHRKSLSKLFTERTQFLQALDRAAGWIKQQEQRVLADEHIALLPDGLSKQVSTCKNICSTLRAYQVELTSLWTQGRELVKDTTEEKKTETLQRLEELQGTFEASLQRCTQHLQHLEKALVIRKYFKVDLDRVCEWLRQAEAATFPVVNLSGSDEELQNQLDKYQQLLVHTSAYENLLLIVQRAGQEILPTLNEVDHCYLDEKLNGLPQQYNNILISTKEKRERVQQVIQERREFESLIEVTRKALGELQEQCDALEKQITNQSLEDGKRLHSDYADLQKGLANLFQALKELRGKTQDFHSKGQPYTPEIIDQLASLHNRLDLVTKEKVKQLNSTLNLLEDYNAKVVKMDSGMNEIKEHMDKLCSEEQLDAMERFSRLHKLAKDLEETISYSESFTGQIVELSQHFDPDTLTNQVASKEPQLQALKSKIFKCIEECECCIVGRYSLQKKIEATLEWLSKLRDRLKCPLNLQETNVDIVQDEVRSVLALQGEVKSRLKLLEVLSQNEKQKYSAEQTFPSHIEDYLKDIAVLETEVQQALTTKQAALQSALSLLQTYKCALKSTHQWNEDADTVLKQTSQKPDLEDFKEYLWEAERVIAQKQTLNNAVWEIEALFLQMEDFFDCAVVEELKQDYESTFQRSSNCLYVVCLRWSTQWRSFQKESEEVVKQMSETERRLAEFSTAKASSLEEAEDKLHSHQMAHGGVQSQRQALEQIADRQQMKYNDLHATLPSEISTQLAEVTLKCTSTQNKCKMQLGISLNKLSELHSQTSRLAEGKTTRLKKAERHFEEFNEMLTLVLNWTEKAETLVSANIIWSPASMMQEQIRTHQALLREWRKLQGEMEGLADRVGMLGEVVQTEALHHQVAELSHHAEELQQRAKSRLLSLQDAAKDLNRLENEVKILHQSIERVQETLASPDLARLSLREQLVQRQLLLTEMEGFKVQVQALQMCMSTLQLPEEVMATLPLCVTAQSLQQDSSQLQHTAIQQCNILQEAMVQYEQYEQEVKNLQKLIEEAHHVIQDRPVATGNIQELKTQIQHHEELAQKIKGYQEQIAALNSKCKMLTVKAKHATMLLTVSEVDGLSDGLEELEDEEVEMSKHPATHPSVVMVSELAALSRAPLQELYDPSMESSASTNLDDLQRSWETLKNVISEKQKSLYEALERQQHYQEALQSVSTKMESIETSLSEGLEPGKSPESQMAAHQALMDEILMLQDEISALQACFSEELQQNEESPEQDAGDQLALHSTLTVLGERMATIRMKASGKRQLLEERLNEQLEEQRQEQALQRYHSEAEELDHWLLSTRATLNSALQPNAEDMDMEEQLIDCQNMLLEIEQKVLCLSELSVHSESLLLEGKAGMRGDAEQLTLKLHSLKASLLELQRILQDKHTHIQVSIMQDTYTKSAESMWDGGGHDLIEEVVDGLEERLRLVDSLLDQRCDSIRQRLQEHTTFQVWTIDVYEELVEMVGSRRSSLNQTLVLKAQYEKALQDLQELVDTAQDKMAADQKMTVGSVLEVQILLDKHKEFFQGLEAHVVLTQAFFRQVSGVVVQREAQVLEQSVAQAQSVLKQAHRRGVELEGILESWSRLVGDYQAVYRQLEAVESSIPSVGLVEETEERLSERIALYQHLKCSLAERQQQLYEVLEDGKKLLLSVCCSELEAQLTQLGEHWLCCTTKVNKELHRLDSTLKHWTRYQSDSAVLGQWLASALDRLEFWSTQSVTVPQELETVRDHLHAFLEFSKEVDAKSSLRSSVLSRGNQLLRLKKVDTASLRSHLAQVETQWADLLTRIPVVQEKLHQLQMEKLPSRHAITELMSWISLMENIIQEDQDKIMEAVGSGVVQTYIQKYKGFRIDLSCKQLTVDFVNQSVLQMSSQDVEGKRSDKTDFAERLGAMNRRWQILQGLITEKIQLLEGLLESWLEYENGVQTLKAWIGMQEEKLKKKPRIEDVASAQSALKNCQELEELVKEKEKELEKVDEKGHMLMQDKKGEATNFVMETLKGLNQAWASLDQMIGQAKVSLRAVLDQWSLYKRAGEEIHGYLMEGRYSISRLSLLTGSPEAVLVQVENLENLQEELDRQESSLKKFGSLSEQLLKDSHPSVADSLNAALSDVNHRWNTLLEQISDQLRSSKSLLQLWQHYKELHELSSKDVQRLEERAERLLNSATHREITEEEVNTWIHDCTDLLKTHGSVQDTLQQLAEIEEQLRLQVEPSAMATFHTDCLSLSQRLATVGYALQRQQSLLEASVNDYESFTDELDSLSRCPEEAEEILKESDPAGSAELSCLQERMEKLKAHMLKLSRLSPDLERLNGLGYRLPLNDQEMKGLQNLNRSWASSSAHTTERFSKLQAVVLQKQSFLEKCEEWLAFLTQTEEKLAAGISGNYQSLLEQQREHELFQAEMFSRQQILYSIINDGHQLLNQGRVEDRDDFGLKLALLSNQWQGVVRRAQQRRGIIDSLVCQWQRYTELAEKLRHWLQEVQEPEEQQRGTVALQQARGILDHIQLKERVLQRQQGSYVLAVEAGRQLLLSADARAEALLQAELTDLQERWRSANIRLDERKKELLSLLKDWEQCEKGIAASHEKLRAFKRKLSLPLPDHHEELHNEQIRCKELEGSTEGWTDDVAGLCVLRDSLSSNLSSDDLTVLQERLELLQRQWEETCHQLALRRQQVTEKLNEWAVFNEKNKELCEWLTHMESKVSQNGDITIEEMIEKLRKDYQEEISVAEENKQQLEQMGERLARASHESKAAEIQYKLSKVNERWQHLLDLIAARVKKLRETLVAVQQLDKNMSTLRSWLAHIETELSRPIVYETCDANEIQKKLNQQQDLQRDIEKHSTAVASVLNLCEVLLHDCDACATETECDSIQQATRGLDRRWRNICAVAMERRLKIEETWRLWQKFLDDYSRFEDWLKASERTAALPNSSGVLYTVAKEELKKFEAFQRQVQECLTQLELINKQYRRLARENRTDSSCRLRQMVHDGNRRWDTLQRRVAAILRRLKHFISQREEFETARDSILVWLTEMDLQLTNIEHFSECDVQAKIKQLKAFQQEIELNTGKIGSVFSQGEALMEKSEPLDAAVIEEELDELQRYCREVFGRVERYYRKLTPPPRANGSGRDTPASVDSIPLEWDHDYDLEPMSHTISSEKRVRDGEEDEDILCSATAALTDVVIPESPEAYIKLTENTLRSSSGRHLVRAYFTTCIAGVIERWELIQAQSHSSEHNPRENLLLIQQLTSDLEAMEMWLSQAEAELAELRGKNLSTDILTIEQRIRKLKELQKAVDAHKSKVLSINLSSVGLLQSDSEESRKLRERLKEMNSRWDRLGKSLQQWRGALQGALMQCQEFHELSHGLLLWLENIDRRRNEIIPISAGLDCQTLRAHYRALQQIQQELMDSEQRVSVLQDLSVQLLVQAQGSECLEAQERVHVIGNRLRLLLKAVASDLQLVHFYSHSKPPFFQDLSVWPAVNDVDTSGSASPVSVVSVPVQHQSPGGSACASSRSGTPRPRGGAAAGRCQPFLLRVLRAALPLQLLLLLIVGLACLVPMTEEDYSCAHANNFARSFHPMLRYTNGPPPI